MKISNKKQQKDSREEYLKFFKKVHITNLAATKFNFINDIEMYFVMAIVFISAYLSKIITNVRNFFIFKLKFKFF